MRTTPALLAAGTLLAVPAAAQAAGTITLDRACYVERSQMVATGVGFTPGAEITLSGDGTFTQAVADAGGTFVAPVEVPINPTIDARSTSIKTYTLQAQNFANPADDTSVQYQVTNFAFESSRGVKSPRAKRTWWFAGFPTGASIYGHFRHGGKTRANYRFGKATGPCGLLKVRARGIPVRRVRSGTWNVQVDTKKSYSKSTRPALTASTTVFTTFR